MDNLGWCTITPMNDREMEKRMVKEGAPTLFPASYSEEPGDRNATSMADLLKSRVAPKKGRATERGELLKYFNEHLTNQKGKRFGIPFIAMKVQGLSVQDLYYLKSVCDQEAGRKFVDKKTGQEKTLTFGMVFWTRLRS